MKYFPTSNILGSLVLDMIKYDIIDALKEKEEFIESSQMNISLAKSEAFIYNEKPSHKFGQIQKRGIVLPLTVMYKSREHMSYEITNNKLLAQYENLCALDKVILKLSSTDLMLLVSIAKRLQDELQQYKNIPPFTSRNKGNLPRALPKPDSNAPQINVIKEKNRIVHDGIQIVKLFIKVIFNGFFRE